MDFSNYNNEDYIYIYAHHLEGFLYITNHKLNYDEIYCEDCRCVDILVNEGYVKDLKSKYKVPVKVLK